MRALLSFLLLPSCASEYELGNLSAGPIPPGTIHVGLSGLDRPFCGELGEGLLVLENVGTQTVTLDHVSLSTQGWEVKQSIQGVTLDPGATRTVPVLTRGGLANASVFVLGETTPVGDGVVWARRDHPPSVYVASPTSGAVLSRDEPTELVAWVADDRDDPSSLELAWATGVGEVFATPAASSQGLAQATWAYAPEDAGLQDLTLSATDTCGNVAVAVVQDVCPQGVSAEPVSVADWDLYGDASWITFGASALLTEAEAKQVSSAFATSAVAMEDLHLRFEIYLGDDAEVGEGLAFVSYPEGGTFEPLWSGYCGLGYLDIASPSTCGSVRGAMPGWAVEFDTRYEAATDTTTLDHIAVVVDGVVDEPTVSPMAGLASGQWRQVELESADGVLKVRVDGELRVESDAPDLRGDARIGFTATTGGEGGNEHAFRSLERLTNICP